jgi:hypothetical protein
MPNLNHKNDQEFLTLAQHFIIYSLFLQSVLVEARSKQVYYFKFDLFTYYIRNWQPNQNKCDLDYMLFLSSPSLFKGKKLLD